MISLVEIEARGGVTEYESEPSWTQQVKANFNKTLSSGLTSSGLIYSSKAMGEQITELKKKEPGLNLEGMEAITNRQLKLYEIQYDKGDLEKLYRPVAGISYDQVKQYIEAVKRHKAYTADQLAEFGKGLAAEEYYKAEQILQKADDPSTTAEIIGGIGAAVTDPVNVALLPFGGPVAREGASILATAGRAAMQEMGIATLAEAAIQPVLVDWNEEIGVRYGVKEAAVSAVMSIGGAGLLRGSGSAMLDLTSDGIKALRKVDPELADDYERLEASRPEGLTMDEHINNLDAVENGMNPTHDKSMEPVRSDPQQPVKLEVPEIDTTQFDEASQAIDDALERIKRMEDCIL